MTNEEAEWPPAQKVVLTFDLEDKDSWAVEVLNETLVFDYEQIRRRSRQEVAIKGAIIGYNDLQVGNVKQGLVGVAAVEPSNWHVQ